MRHSLWSILLLATSGLGAEAPDTKQLHPHLTELNPDWVITADEAYQWASVKNDNLPTLTGSPEWLNYMAFLEQTLAEYGAVDGVKNSWEFERWFTSEDNRQWSLVSDGSAVRVASYGAYSGSTTSEGITADLIYYDHVNPPEDIEGKIVVIPTRPHPSAPFSEDYLINYTFNDYEYATDADTLPAPFEFVEPLRALPLIFGGNWRSVSTRFQEMATQREPSSSMTWPMSAPAGCIPFQSQACTRHPLSYYPEKTAPESSWMQRQGSTRP